MRWRAIHVHYHDDNRDRLILDAIRPLFERIADVAPDAYFVPHWRLGPHLRLNIRSDEDTFAGTVCPAAEEIIGGFLRAHPSTVELNQAEILPLHERLAALENESGPLSPWLANNTISVAPYDDRLAIHQNAETAEMLAKFYLATTSLTFDMVAATPAPNDRRRLAFALLIGTVQAYAPGGLARDYVTFRSHTEAFLHSTADGWQYRRDWDAMFERNKDRFIGELVAAKSTVDSQGEAGEEGGNSMPLLREWVTTLRPTEQLVRQLVSDGALYLPSADPAKFEDLSSEFHRALYANQEAMDRLRTDEFSVFRQLINYAYLHLTRLGLTPLERHALCHLAANATDRHYGTTAVDVISGAGIDR